MGGGGVYKLTKNPNLKKKTTFFLFLGGEGGGRAGGRVNKCFKRHFYSSRKTTVSNYSDIHA